MDLQLAQAFLLPSVAAAVIGGTSIFGGVGSYSGTILGALILSVLSQMLTFLSVGQAVQQIVYGVDRPRPVLGLRPGHCGAVGATMKSDIGAAVVGVGFIGVAHIEALRRLGVEVVGVVGSSPERASQKAEAANLHPPSPTWGRLDDPT